MEIKDTVFIQEEKHLKSVVENIINLIHKTKNAINACHSDKDSTTKEGYADIIANNTNRKYYISNAEKYTKFLLEPYFCRIFYIDRDNNESSYYFSRRGLLMNEQNKIIALGWQSSVYYVDSLVSGDEEISINGKSFVAFLKRDFIIENSKLTKYIETGSGGSEDGATDSFLKRLLIEKKNDHRLTDIIRTIQKKQSQIIRLDINKSFIVQGCAGSGKTMILLHRLSVIKYNNPSLNWDMCKIITPSKFFEVHIRELVKDLDIDNIKPMTLLGYYSYLLQKYENSFKHAKFTLGYSTQYGSIDAFGDDVPNDFLDVVYSDNFKLLCVKLFSKYMNEVIESGHIDVVVEICKKHNYKIEIDEDYKEEYIGDRYRKYFSDIINYSHELKIQKEKSKFTIEVNLITTKERKIIDKINSLFSPKSIIDSTLKFLIKELMESLDIKKKKEVYNKFRLYLLLIFWNWFKTSPLDADKYIHIDEGQDISISEYKLLNNINKNAVFNVYGDINQLIDYKRGIKKWTDLKSIIPNCNYFELNENYRNTIEITEYCNNLFELGIDAIGKTNGEHVREISIDLLMLELKNLLKTSDRNLDRIAIIAKSDSILESIIKQLNNSTKLDFLTIQLSKGLEFDIVYVLNSNLNKNERYIAYTRALGQLIIVNGEIINEEIINNEYFDDLAVKFSKTNKERLSKI